VNLGVLSIFKYADFAVDSVSKVLATFGVEASHEPLGILLPIGISFFTFESMSYVIDVYRGDIKPQKSYLEYLSFVAFFPHLVAGPIVRPRDLLPQLAGGARFSSAEASEGMFLIALGLVKKVAIGDYLALNLVDRVFDAPLHYSALECYAAVLGYAVQIYCDFSGYTDIAIGSALLLGVRFPLNFNAPYKAKNVVDFWRRWHISLSTWLRDYLYVPLGGNRKGPSRTYVNLMVTMLLGGLWHGAAWNFVVWGGLHGAALAVTRFWHNRRGSQTQAGRRSSRATGSPRTTSCCRRRFRTRARFSRRSPGSGWRH
jgi:D-alanyl-lipoteichoic acid acyltransferase DltB (MBOAT superfamily)